MRGFVPTPPSVVDLMVEKLLAGFPVDGRTRVLEPGCGDGALIDGILRWCAKRGVEPPLIDGVELAPGRASTCAAHFADQPNVRILEADFLRSDLPNDYDLVIGNPPYVSITSLAEDEKAWFRSHYEVATGRFDLYMLFIERALRLLRTGGRLVFITPEKFLYVASARRLRQLLSDRHVAEVHLVPTDTFGDLITYPTITTVNQTAPTGRTKCVLRGGEQRAVNFGPSGDSLLPQINNAPRAGESGLILADVCDRVSAGVATGADPLFVLREHQVPLELRHFGYPTVSGRQLGSLNRGTGTQDVMLVPYDSHGGLMEEQSLGPFREYLAEPSRVERLKARTCVRRKPWYAFHETPPMTSLLRPKILCKDVAPTPRFWIDYAGTVVPRHSVYYLVPREERLLEPLAAYLASAFARDWLEGHCQRAANGYMRLQSRVMLRLPIPTELVEAVRRPTDATADRGPRALTATITAVDSIATAFATSVRPAAVATG